MICVRGRSGRGEVKITEEPACPVERSLPVSDEVAMGDMGV